MFVHGVMNVIHGKLKWLRTSGTLQFFPLCAEQLFWSNCVFYSILEFFCVFNTISKEWNIKGGSESIVPYDIINVQTNGGFPHPVSFIWMFDHKYLNSVIVDLKYNQNKELKWNIKKNSSWLEQIFKNWNSLPLGQTIPRKYKIWRTNLKALYTHHSSKWQNSIIYKNNEIVK